MTLKKRISTKPILPKIKSCLTETYRSEKKFWLMVMAG
jgi:hypothetical protein